MDIEEVAESTPDKILSFSIDPATGYQGYHGRRIAFNLGLDSKQTKQCVALMGNLYNLFVDKDMEMLEIIFAKGPARTILPTQTHKQNSKQDVQQAKRHRQSAHMSKCTHCGQARTGHSEASCAQHSGDLSGCTGPSASRCSRERQDAQHAPLLEISVPPSPLP